MASPSDILSGVLAVPLTDSDMRALFVIEALVTNRLEHENVLNEFEAFTLEPARVDAARLAFAAAKTRWTANK